MDHAVALVQAYLQLNGYFTSAEYPIIAAAGRNGFRTLTDIDVLAFRFPSGLPSPVPIRSRQRTPRGLDMNDVDPGLGVPPDAIDMLIPAFGFLMTLEKAKRGGAGRRGQAGVEIVSSAPRESRPRRTGR